MNYKRRLNTMWDQGSPTAEEILDITAEFCDEIGTTPNLRADIYDVAGKLFACIGMLQKLEAEADASLRTMKLNNQDDAIADLQMRVEALEKDYDARQGDGK